VNDRGTAPIGLEFRSKFVRALRSPDIIREGR
jgi:hypothetical protein